MTSIPQQQLRNQVGEVLRRLEEGERLVVTVSGRPVAQLSPLRRHRWVSGVALGDVWRGPEPRSLTADLEALDVGVIDPFSA